MARDQAAQIDPPNTIEELKHQYAAGEITESEFERKLDQLVEADDRLNETELTLEQYSHSTGAQPAGGQPIADSQLLDQPVDGFGLQLLAHRMT